ncbi:MAG: 16S rRNA (adenine(1518)-N(6)/adenine(1519)-N(6))-dimethyltransferase RsmA [Acholeplasmataceae bacterium]|jgi:16S rRNA (adenine1518-N6/adenine1519-N6)-dimethyltransferase|nr:16S rRNA (adenine(1518)-N(6)/adenine(1519)-N(6))-dimethyltransferase RsmA [Acholeplasmataceae bacterium]
MQHQAKKRFGQNFLRDKNLLSKIVRESNIENKHVIEVGPGQGALTSYLAETAADVVAYEIDTSLAPHLNVLTNQYPNLKIIYQDFLDVDLSKEEHELHVVANVPYYITTPILFKLLEVDQIRTATLMIQKEVCDRLLAQPNTKAYNALSVILQYQARVNKMMDVKRQLFYPVPNVDSAVIRIEKRETPLLNEKKKDFFIDLVKAAFKQKRKTLVNNLFEAFHISKKDIENYLIQLNISTQTRAEALSLETFIQLAKEWPYDY